MDKKYRVVFLNLIESQEAFHNGMAKLGVSARTIDRMIQSAPIILKENMPLAKAGRYARAIQEAGGEVGILAQDVFEESKRPERCFSIEPLESFTMCPECGFKQLRAEACVKCGFLFEPRETGRGKQHVRGR